MLPGTVSSIPHHLDLICAKKNFEKFLVSTTGGPLGSKIRSCDRYVKWPGMLPISTDIYVRSWIVDIGHVDNGHLSTYIFQAFSTTLHLL
jgi:hypothetical protein